MILSLLINFSWAAEHPVIRAKDHLPYEFRLLTKSANLYFTSSVDHYNLVNELKDIDASLEALKKEEQFFLIKSEIYKEILRFRPENELLTRYIEPQTLRQLEEKAKSFEQNAFVAWLIGSIKEDLTPLLSSSIRNTYNFQRQSKTPITDNELKKYENKLKILIPWAILFLQKSDDEINLYAKELISRTLKSVGLALSEFNKISKNQVPAPVGDVFKLSHFSVTKKLPEASNSALEKELLDTDFNETAATSKSGWTPKEEETQTAIFPTPDPNYVPPAKLPEAKNDWQQEYLFPKPDPNYQAPSALPQAKNDWDKEYLYPTPDPDYIPPASMPVPVDSWESVSP